MNSLSTHEYPEYSLSTRWGPTENPLRTQPSTHWDPASFFLLPFLEIILVNFLKNVHFLRARWEPNRSFLLRTRGHLPSSSACKFTRSWGYGAPSRFKSATLQNEALLRLNWGVTGHNSFLSHPPKLFQYFAYALKASATSHPTSRWSNSSGTDLCWRVTICATKSTHSTAGLFCAEVEALQAASSENLKQGCRTTILHWFRLACWPMRDNNLHPCYTSTK